MVRMRTSCFSLSWSTMSPILSPCLKKLCPSVREWVSIFSTALPFLIADLQHWRKISSSTDYNVRISLCDKEEQEACFKFLTKARLVHSMISDKCVKYHIFLCLVDGNVVILEESERYIIFRSPLKCGRHFRTEDVQKILQNYNWEDPAVLHTIYCMMWYMIWWDMIWYSRRLLSSFSWWQSTHQSDSAVASKGRETLRSRLFSEELTGKDWPTERFNLHSNPKL